VVHWSPMPVVRSLPKMIKKKLFSFRSVKRATHMSGLLDADGSCSLENLRLLFL